MARFLAVFALIVLAACGGDTLPVADTSTTLPAATAPALAEPSLVPATTAADDAPAATVEDCAPRAGTGRALTGGEWAMLSAFLSDEDSARTLSSDGITGEVEGFFSWCELRDHPTYSVGYGAMVDDLDGMLQAARLVCDFDDSGVWVCGLTGDEPAAPAPTVTVATPVDYPTTSVAGSGNRVVDLEIAGGGLCTITMTVTDNIDYSFDMATEGNFFVEQVDPPSFDTLWAFEMLTGEGTWEKAVRFDPVESGAVTLEVTAEGDWTIESDCRG